MEERVRLNVSEVRYKCDMCEKGYMEVDDEITPSYYNSIEGLTVPHSCNHCGNTVVLSRLYPYKEYTTSYEIL